MRSCEVHGCYSKTLPISVDILYLESTDGLEWQEKHRCEIDVAGQSGFDGFTFFVDPVCDPQERYKIVFSVRIAESEQPQLWERFQKLHPRHRDVRIREDRLNGLYALTSPDGWSGSDIRIRC